MIRYADDALTEALDALEAGDTTAAAEAFGTAWLETYGMDVDASVRASEGVAMMSLLSL